jgi:methylamine dehydrogenase accessory protein MauD
MSMTALTVMVIVLFVMVLGLSIAVFALSRQVGILFERVAPMGALIIDAGPKVGAASPIFDVPTLNGGRLKLGGASERPVCKKLLPVLRSMRPAEAQWLDVVLASDGDSATHERFAQANSLQTFPYVLSTELGVSFRVSRLPFAVLLDEQGIVRAKGLINNREQLESLFSAKELGIESIQSYLEQAA